MYFDNLSIQTMQKILELAWPRFLEREGCVVIDWCEDESSPLSDDFDRTGRECFVNHVHILDLVEHNAADEKAESYTFLPEHPDFLAACRIGRLLARTWLEKLRKDFPDDDFRVYFTRDDNPIVRFHRVYESESPWMEDLDDDNDQILILDTRR